MAQRRTVLVGGSALVLVLAVVVALSAWGGSTPTQGDDASAPASGEAAPVPDAPRVHWARTPLDVEVETGSHAEVSVTFELPDPVADVSLHLDAVLEELIGAATLPLGDLPAGTHDLPLALHAPVETPSDTDPPILRGQLGLVGADGRANDRLDVEVAIIDLDVERARIALRPPSAARLVATPLGAVVTEEVTVLLDGGPDAAAQVAEDHGATLVGSSPAAGVFQLQQDGTIGWEELLDLADELTADPRVLQATPSGLAGTDRLTPDDAALADDWSSPGGTERTWHLEQVRAPEAWALVPAEAEQTTVAVLDGGFDRRHEDLTFAEVVGTSRLTNDGGHGTHVAGLACADADNGIGVAGLSWNCDLRAYNVLRSYLDWEDGFDVPLDRALLYEQMHLAATDGARVVNLSLGYRFKRDDEVCAALDQRDTPIGRQALLDHHTTAWVAYRASNAADQPVLWITSAGNDACDAHMVWPASLSRPLIGGGGPPSDVTDAATSTWMSVAGTNRDGELSASTNRAIATSVAAPGGEWQALDDPVDPGVFSTLGCPILAVVPAGGTPGPCRSYGHIDGTSMASPVVAGTAAMLLSARPDLPASRVRDCLISSGADRVVSGSRADGLDGFGLLDAEAALTCALEADATGPADPDAAGAGLTATEVREVRPVDTDGQPLPGIEVVPDDGPGVANCLDGTPAAEAVAPDVVDCGRGAEVCWVGEDRSTLYCGGDPWSQRLRELRAETPVPPTGPATDPRPMAMELVNGERCFLRRGGAWTGRLDGLAAAYYCTTPEGDVADAFDDGLFILAGSEGVLLDRSGDIWSVGVGGLSDTEPLPPPVELEVATAWFAGRP